MVGRQLMMMPLYKSMVTKKVRGWTHPNTATFRVYALGYSWNSGSSAREGIRIHEPIVTLPENRNINQGNLFPRNKGTKPNGAGSGLGLIDLVENDSDGSARITINMNEIYASTKTKMTLKGRKNYLVYDNNLVRMPENLADSGITGNVHGALIIVVLLGHR